MSFNLLTALPQLLPGAIKWAESESQKAEKNGRKLTPEEMAGASLVGVSRPEMIRIRMVKSLPMPEDELLKEAALQTGLLGPNMVGLTLGHSILVVEGYAGPRLLSHEFRHVRQYEEQGSISHFLPIYLQQIALIGYHDAPFERDARAHELGVWPEV